jgi:hypothetical protein
MATATVKKPVALTYLATEISADAVAFTTIADLRSALKRVATFGLVGTKNRPLLADELTESEIARFNAAKAKWLDEGKDANEFTDSPKIWSDGIDPIWLPAVRVDVERILASLIDIDYRNDGSSNLLSWNLQVNGYCVPCRKVLGAVAGEKGSKLTLKGIVAACR